MSMTLLCFMSLPFSNICKINCQPHASFRTNYIIVLHVPKWPTLKNLSVLVSVLRFLSDSGYIFNGSIDKMQEKRLHMFILVH